MVAAPGSRQHLGGPPPPARQPANEPGSFPSHPSQAPSGSTFLTQPRSFVVMTVPLAGHPGGKSRVSPVPLTSPPTTCCWVE